MPPNPSPTPNLHLQPIAANRNTWAEIMNDNLRLIDATVGTYFIVQNLQGAWQNSTAYVIGQSVIDTMTSVVYQCQVDHTSAAIPTTFEQDREAHTGYWNVYSSPATARGVWLPDTGYSLNDFVVNGGQYAICVETHRSSSSFEDDLAANKWSVLIDVSGIGGSVLPDPGGSGDENKFAVTNSSGNGYTIVSATNALSLLGATELGVDLFQAASSTVARTLINAQIAGSYQPLSASLTSVAGVTPGTFGLSLLTKVTAANARSSLGLGTAATLDVGTGASQVVQMTASAKLPAVDGSALTNLPAVAYFSTGDIKMTWKSVADSGWIMHNDGSIGDGSSGATARANADTSSLFALLWNNFTNTDAPVSGGRGANASADFAAHKRITLPKALGHAIGVAGAGSGLTSRTLGHEVGEEEHVLTSTEMPSHTHGSVVTSVGSLGAGGDIVNSSPDGSFTSTPSFTTGSTGSAGSDTAHNNMQPTQWYNIMVKL